MLYVSIPFNWLQRRINLESCNVALSKDAKVNKLATYNLTFKPK